MVRKKKKFREEPDGLCSCLLTSCKSFLPSQSHTSFSLLLHRQRNVKVSEKRTLYCTMLITPTESAVNFVFMTAVVQLRLPQLPEGGIRARQAKWVDFHRPRPRETPKKEQGLRPKPKVGQVPSRTEIVCHKVLREARRSSGRRQKTLESAREAASEETPASSSSCCLTHVEISSAARTWGASHRESV